MSTHGKIFIKLKDEDLGKELPLYDCNNEVVGYIHTAKDKPYMSVYCHQDCYERYPGLGYDLTTKIGNYDDALKFVSQGNRVSFSEPFTNEGLHIEEAMPKMGDDITTSLEDYVYLFDNGKWYVRSWYEGKFEKDWREINVEKEDEMVEINKKDLEAISWMANKFERIYSVVNDIEEVHYLVCMRRVRDIIKKLK